jgi:hypothetical protein
VLKWKTTRMRKLAVNEKMWKRGWKRAKEFCLRGS